MNDTIIVMRLTFLGAVLTFCIVPDLVTAAGARRYVELQEEALAGRDVVRAWPWIRS